MGSYKITYTPHARKQFKSLDKSVQRRIQKFLNEVAELADPHVRGCELKWDWAGFWRYRVGDYRIVCDIVEEQITICVVEVGHRREIY